MGKALGFAVLTAVLGGFAIGCFSYNTGHTEGTLLFSGVAWMGTTSALLAFVSLGCALRATDAE